jgi:hypothetical protein
VHAAKKRYNIFLCSLCRLIVTANFVPSSSILVTLIMEALRSSETLVISRVAPHIIQEDGILQFYEPPRPVKRTAFLFYM